MSRKFTLDSIDEYLGPSEGRFFGSGYRRSVYSFNDPVPVEDGFRSQVDIDYPVDWSRKKEGDDLTPHLSTVDVMVLGMRCVETLMEKEVGLSEKDIGAARIRKMVIRAGTRPQEDLVDVPLSAAITRRKAEGDWRNLVSTFDIRVGVMSSRVQVEHGKPREIPLDAGDWSTLTGRDDRYWGTGYRREDQLLRNVSVDLGELRCRADVELRKEGYASGLGSRCSSTMTVVDGFVSLLQMAQVLLYEIDGLDRSNSDTLWMQQVVLRQGGPATERDDTGAASLVISDHQLLDMSDGQWRNAELKGRMGDVTMSATFAHRISKSEKGKE